MSHNVQITMCYTFIVISPSIDANTDKLMDGPEINILDKPTFHKVGQKQLPLSNKLPIFFPSILLEIASLGTPKSPHNSDRF